MTRTVIILLLLTLSLPVFADDDETAGDDVTTLTYLGTNQYRPENLNVIAERGYVLNVFNFDAQGNLEKSLTKDLPPNEVAAEQLVQERFNKIPQQELHFLSINC